MPSKPTASTLRPPPSQACPELDEGWVCFQTCRNGTAPAALVEEATYLPDECPYLALDHPYGQIINVSERFKAVS